MSGNANHSRRIGWIDALKGVTILLVVMRHVTNSVMASQRMLDLPALPGVFTTLMGGLTVIRMPAFFLSAGIVFALTMARGWGRFARHRVAFAIWVILIWTALSYAVEALGINLYPWNNRFPSQGLEQALWSPYGNLWFVYAILIVSALAMALRGLPLLIQIMISVGLAALCAWASEAQNLARGVQLLLINLGQKGIPFFMIGIWAGPALGRGMATRRGALLWGSLGVLVFVAVIMLFGADRGKQGQVLAGLPLLWAQALPAVMAFVAMVRLASGWRPFSTAMTAVGQHSLHLFLIHEFAIALIWYSALPPIILASTPLVGATILYLLVLALSAVLIATLEATTGQFAFQAPGFIRRPPKPVTANG